MSAAQVSAPPHPPSTNLDPHPITSSPIFNRSPSPSQQQPLPPNSTESDTTNDRNSTMDNEANRSGSDRQETSLPPLMNHIHTNHHENVQDQMQVDSNSTAAIATTVPTLPPLSSILLPSESGLGVLSNFGLPSQPVPEGAAQIPSVHISERDIPTPPLSEAIQQSIFINDPPPPIVNDMPPPPPPAEEEEDDFDGHTYFLQHMVEDTSEPPAEQLEEMSRQERAGGRNLQLSGLNDEHWMKLVETSLDDPAFVPKEHGKFTWHLDRFHGTKANPSKDRILRSPSFEVGGFKWNIKLFPHGCEGTDYVSIHIECGGRVDGQSTDGNDTWDVAAQIGCVMFNPTEPRTHHFERTVHHFENGNNADWGWVRFYGPWQELHIRKFLEYRPMLQNDKISFTAYVRVWEDPTKLLWSSRLKNGQWDSFKQTGFRGLTADSTGSTALTSALSLLFHTSIFNEIIAAAPLNDQVRRPTTPRTPMIQELKRALNRWHALDNSATAESLSGVQRIFSWYGHKFDSTTDVIQIWQALSQIITLELATTNSLRPSHGAEQSIILVRDIRAPFIQGISKPEAERKEAKSVQDIFMLTEESQKASNELLFGYARSGNITPDIIAIELNRSKYDIKKRKWCKLTHHIKLDPVITINDKSYHLTGAVIHRGDLGSGDVYSVVRPEDSKVWLKYRNGQVSFLTKKQAVDIHEGKGEGKVGTDSLAYVLMYALQEDSPLIPSRETFKSLAITTKLAHTTPDIRADEPIPVVIHDAKNVVRHSGLGFVDLCAPNQAISFSMRASASLSDVQAELLDRLKASGRVERQEQLRLWPIRTSRASPIPGLDADRWPSAQLMDFVYANGGAHLWLEIIPIDQLSNDDDSNDDPMQMSIASLAPAVTLSDSSQQASIALFAPMIISNGGVSADVVMANTEDEASDSGSENDEEDDDEEEDEDDDGSSTSAHPEWELTDSHYVILKTWNPTLLQLACQGTYFVPERKQNVLEFVRKTLKIPTSTKVKVWQETGLSLDRELSPSSEFRALDSYGVVLVVSPELAEKVKEQRRKAGDPISAPDWYKILQDKRDPAYRQPFVIKDHFGGPYIQYATSATQPRRKSIVVDTKGDAFIGDLDLNWVKNGNGTMIYTNGDRYQGEWKDDQLDGHGIMTYYPSGNKYEGGWSAGRRHGKGVMYYEQSEDQLKTCKICYEEEMNTVLVKCGHIVACHICARELKDCPVCRRPVQDIVRMYPTV